MNNAFFDLKSNLSGLSGECIHGVCTFILQLYEDDTQQIREDLWIYTVNKFNGIF